MEIYSEDIELLTELISGQSINLYFFHEKYKLSPAQLGRSLNKFNEIGIISLEEKKVAINEKGKEWILKNRKKLFLNGKTKYWKEVPENMKQESIKINELYLPNRKNIDKEIFKNIEGGK